MANLPAKAPAVHSDSAGFTEASFGLNELTGAFLAHVQLMVRAGVTEPTTLDWYRSQFAHVAHLGAFPAAELRTHHLGNIELTNALARALKRLYRWAAAEDLIPRDPFARLAVPPCGERRRVLTRAELARLYRAASAPFRRLLFVQLRTLARPGEIRGLVWSQVRFDLRVILLDRFKGQKRRRDRLRVRAIPFDKVTARLLANLFRKSQDSSPPGRVFVNTRGRPWSANAARCAMRRARCLAGLNDGGENVCLYTLRHTSATNAIRANVALKKVAEVMGHARTATTERYLHLDLGDLVGAIDQANTRPRS